MSDQGQGQFRGETWETKSDTPSPTPFPGTTSPSPVQRNADALGAAPPTTHATPTALSPPSNVGETREGAAGESNTSTSQSGTNHNDGTMSQDIALDNAPYCAVKSTVARALDAEHKDQHPHSACDKTKEHLSEGPVVLSEYALDFSKEFVTNVGELTAEHMVEHAVKHAVSKEIVEHVVKDGVVGHVMEHKKAIAGGAVALAAAGPVAITLAICGVLKVVGGCVVDLCGTHFRASHNKWWSSFGDMLLGDKRVTKIMVQAMQAEPCSSMITELKLAMCSMAANVDAQALAQQGILNVNYQAYTYLKEARDKAMTFLHNSQNGEPMSYVMAARVIMVFDCLCDRRALHSKALVTMEKLMTKDRVKDLMKQANNSRTKDYMSPLGELISFVQMTNAFIGMHNVDVGIPDYDAYVICYSNVLPLIVALPFCAHVVLYSFLLLLCFTGTVAIRGFVSTAHCANDRSWSTNCLPRLRSRRSRKRIV